ncbi:hypothetical protein HYH02_006513 [Chlamydomonas schloesseri]|uniref:Anaphase-promoting complex subunit 5 n=1 Tax=Chlamydomonas schloesseri TaxID=2026947 RepID=A0A836B634_9CHLO|nr:hypothetical protein HYH02_006513 [Chlamydomonas schloesseri]|eukprot:KAG2448625.1 hypothetical protein HYH02_006513 [Chlamydomonas schloesseri]
MASSVQPEEVYLSVLVHFFVHPPPAESLRNQDKRSVSRQLAVFLLKELKEPDSAVFPTLRQLCAKLQQGLGELGSGIVGCLEVTLRNIRTPHDLYKLFEILGKLLIRSSDPRAQNLQGNAVAGLDPLSPLGLFLRRVRVRFLSMSFEAAAQLHTAIASDVMAAAAAAAAAAGGGGDPGAAAAAAGARADGGALRDRPGLEAFVASLLRRINQQGPGLPQSALDEVLAPLEAGAAGPGPGSEAAAAGGGGGGREGEERLPLARMVRLQSALRHRDYTAALDLLHSYYNTMGTGGAAGRTRNTAGLLSLSALQAGLGHTSEALQALNEAMRLAQQAGDGAALLQALAMLCSLLASTAPGAPGLPPHGPAALRSGAAHHVQLLRMLRRCGERGRELGQPALVAFAALATARFALQHDVEPSDSGLHAPPGSLTASAPVPAAVGGGAAPAASAPSAQDAWGSGAGAGSSSSGSEMRPAPLMVATAVRDTLSLATAAALSAAAPAAPPPPPPADGAIPARAAAAAAADLYPSPALFDRSLPRGAAAAAADAVQEMAGAAHLLQSAAWGVHGHSSLERVHSLMYLTACSDPRLGGGAAGRFEDRGAACAQLLAAAARRGPAAAAAAARACLGYLSLPWWADAGAGAAADGAGNATATVAAQEAEEEREGGGGLALWGGTALAAAWLCAQHDKALAAGDLAAAAALTGQLAGLADPQPHRDVDIRLEAARRGCLNLLAAGNTAAAHEAAMDLFARCADAGLQAPALRALLLLADVHLAAGDPYGALPHVLACLLPAQPGGLNAAAGAGAAAAAAAGTGGAGLAGAAAGGAGGAAGGGRSHDLLAAEALVLLCRVWHELSDGQQLLELLVLLQDALPLILAHGSSLLQARAQLTLAEMVLASCGGANGTANGTDAESTEAAARDAGGGGGGEALAHCYSQLQRLLGGAMQAATEAEDYRLGALAAALLAWLHHSQGAEAAREAAAAAHEQLLARQDAAEAAAGAEGRPLWTASVVGPEAAGGWGAGGVGPSSGVGLAAAMLGAGAGAGIGAARGAVC